MVPRMETVLVTTAADGSATVYSNAISGRILGIRYVKTDFADGSTITITANTTGEAIWAESNVNASASRYPRVGICTTAGVASLYAAAGLAVNEPIAIANQLIKIVIASGGNAKTGTFYIIYG